MRHRRDFRPGICLAFSLVLGTAVANAQIVYTCDSSIATTTCTYLNTTVAGFYSSTFSNANASIYIRMGSASLGLSAFVPTGVTYTKYVAALTANTNKSAVQTAALAALNANDATPYGSGSVAVTGALGAALGFTKLNGVMSDGSTICTLPATGCYNSVITITNDPNVTLYYDDKGGTEPDGAFDFYAVVQHETDEVLGTPSCVGTGSSSVEPAVAGQTRLVKTVILSPSGVSAAATSASAPTLTDFCGTGIPSAV
ncbi:MAG: hypothetical protein JO336_07940, partial [Acidobacteriia bacterium]|nr:hypothetical protein [Terriglobia bacterium]MBV8902257.1 hypothetical protein [Terriglobia bacterium]